MSPEQATGDGHLDGRSDIYSLGCVLYEMLAGGPPFVGSSAQAIFARHMVDPVPRLRTVRQTVPAAVEWAIEKAMAKVPVDRFPTAAQFSEALLKVGGVGGLGRSQRLARWLLPAGAAAAVSAAALVAVRWSRGPIGAVDPNLVAVIPFRVSGTDTWLASLHEGMVDLLGAKLSGDVGPRAVNSRIVLSAWRRAAPSATTSVSFEEAARFARRLGAGRVVIGDIVGSPGRMTLNASLVETPSGRTTTTGSVRGPADSILALVDQLVARLVAASAGEAEHRLADLMTHSLPALRAYLAGQAANRAGRFGDGYRSLVRAIQLDSTFALAAVTLAGMTGYWGDPGDEVGRGLAMAWREQGRLSARDRAFLRFVAGPHYPQRSTLKEKVTDYESAAAVLPDRVEIWYQLGDHLFHWGLMLGIADAPSRAAAAFDRALALDSTFGYALEHRILLAVRDGDTAIVRRLAGRFMATSGAGENAPAVRWLTAVALGDTASLRVVRSGFDTASTTALGGIRLAAQQYIVMLADAEAATAVLWSRAETRAEREIQLSRQRELALNRGRPHEALALAVAHRNVEEPNETFSEGRGLVFETLYWNGDSAAAASVVRQLAPRAARPLARDALLRDRQYSDICALEHWRLAQGESGSASRAIATLSAATSPPDDPRGASDMHLCAAMLDVLMVIVRHRPAGEAVQRLDSIVTSGEGVLPPLLDLGNLILIRGREAQGDLQGALSTARRRPLGLVAPSFLTTALREEGRLAALAGDTAGAVKSYRHYLALRSDPELPLRAERDGIKAELARLVGRR
jgi:eukaryotic-like serine/threonine-protein kinase